MFLTVHYPDIAKKTRLLHCTVMVRKSQKHSGLYRDVLKHGFDVLEGLISLLVIVILAQLISLSGHLSFYRQKQLGQNRSRPSQILSRGAAATLERAARRHEPGQPPPPGDTGTGATLPQNCPLCAAPWNHRQLAGFGLQ